MTTIIDEIIIVARTGDGRIIRRGYTDLALTGEQEARITADIAAALGEPIEIETPTTFDAIRLACKRIPGYDQLSSEELAARIQQPVCMRPTDRTNLFRLVMQHGGVAGDFANIWSYPIFVQDLDQSLANGWLESTSFMLDAAPFTLSDPTKQAIQLALGELAMTRIDVSAEELGITPPGTVTPADVDLALGRT